MITKENLLKNGYKIYNNTLKSSNEYYIESFEKRFNDEKGVKYFIHINCYDFRPMIKHITELSFDSEVQFNTKKDETFNAMYFINDKTTIDNIELFFEDMWTKMNCKHYE